MGAMLRKAWNWLWKSYYVRVIRRAVADSLSLVGWNLKALMYPALYSLCVILIYWDTAGRVAAQQEVSVAIVGLKAAGLAFGVGLLPNLVMAPIRMERELKADAAKWHGKLKVQINENKKLIEGAETAAQLAATTAHPRESVKPLSDEARELLLEAVKDPHGSVLWVPTKTSGDIQTNGRSFGNRKDPKEQARWKAALDELLNRRFLEQVYGMDFKVTKAGYDMAEALTKPDD